jgi:hypothetical protein
MKEMIMEEMKEEIIMEVGDKDYLYLAKKEMLEKMRRYRWDESEGEDEEVGEEGDGGEEGGADEQGGE